MTAALRIPLLHYGLAIGSTALAVVARLALDPLLGDRVPFITLFAAVILTAWYSGRGPAVATLFLGAAAAAFFILPPRFSFRVDQPEYVAGMVLYMAVGGGAIGLFEALRRAQAAIAEQREWLRVTLTSIGDAVIAADLDGRVTFLNPVAEELTGWRQPDALGLPLEDVFVIVNEDTRRSVENPALRALRDGQIVGLANHTLLIARDGSELPLDDAAAPIRDQDGRLRGAVLVFRDASLYRRQERELRERDERLRFALTAGGMIAWDCDLTTGQILRSDTAGRLGLTAGPVDAFLALVHPQDRETVRTAFDRASRGQAEYDVEFRLMTPAGRVRWVVDKAQRRTDAATGRPHLTGVLIDVTDRRAAEEQFRTLAESIPQLCWMANADGHIFWYNRRWYEYTGTTFEQMQGWGWQTVHDPAMLPQVVERWKGSLATGRPFDMVFPLRGADGTFRPFLTRILPIRDEAGQVVRWFGTNTDVRDAVRAEEALRYQLDLTRNITDNATTAIFLMDECSRCTFMNPAAEEMTGFTFAEAEGRILHDLIQHHHPDGRPYPMPECPIDRALPEGLEVRDHEDMFIRKNGTFFPVCCNAQVIFKNGVPVGTVIEVRDVTGEKQAAEATRKRSEQLQRLARLGAEVNVAHDAPSILQLVTDEARQLIGAHQGVSSLTVDHDWAQSVTAVSLADCYAAWRSYDVQPTGLGIYSLVCRTNRPMRLTQAELEAHPAWKGFGDEAGRHPPMRGWLAAPLVGRDGRNIGLIQLSDKDAGEFTADDEAMLVQLAQMASIALENARLYADLREADRRKDEFLATLAHELRNPLAPIRNGLNLMRLAGPSGNSSVEQARAMMDRQLTQLVRLVDDLLDVSRITRGKLELRKERVDLATVIHSAVETSRPLLERMRHRFTVSLPDRPVFLDADLTRLAQVFLNLLNNAAKYTPPGGEVRLTAAIEADEVVVRVRDNGVGIPADMLPRIFEMFTQVDRPLERTTGGLGIGLTLVERLVTMHGGRVSAHSDGPGQGTEVVVRLPRLVEESGAAAVGPATAPAASPARRRVLLVDDNRDAADSLAMMLQLLGHDVHVAYDGVAAVAAADRLRPEVVLLDIGLPGLNGYEVARRIRARPGGQETVLVALTGWGQEEDQRRALDAGFDHHLVKPADPAVLQAILAAGSAAKAR